MKRLALIAILLLGGCGYGLVGRTNFLDPSIRTIEVPAFVNRTTRVELEQRVTQAVAEEFVSRGRLRLVSSAGQADAILRGSIDTFNIFPIAFDQGRATRYQISITANIELLDHRNEDKVLWKNDQYRFTENYEVNLESSTDAFDQETRAIQEIAVRFAEGLVTNLLEGF
jgi:outer membrane lipopolysaccharide assembly protein LptE/RlpB